MWIIELATILVALAIVIAVVFLIWRRVRLLRAGGVPVALRWRIDDAGHGWHVGVARYRGSQFAWYRVFSLLAGPSRIIVRESFAIATRRKPTTAELYAMPIDAVILQCHGMTAHSLAKGAGTHNPSNGTVEIAMSPDVLTGFLSWLEAAPPGSSISR